MSVIIGKNVVIYKGSSNGTVAIAAAKSCTVSRSVDMIEKASSTQGTDKEYTTGRKGWDVSIDHLVTTGHEFEGVDAVGQTFTLRIVINGVTKTGTAICEHSDLSAPVRGLATGVVRFKGSGALTTVTNP